MNMEYQFTYDPNGCRYSQERPLPMKMEGNVTCNRKGLCNSTNTHCIVQGTTVWAESWSWVTQWLQFRFWTRLTWTCKPLSLSWPFLPHLCQEGAELHLNLWNPWLGLSLISFNTASFGSLSSSPLTSLLTLNQVNLFLPRSLHEWMNAILPNPHKAASLLLLRCLLFRQTYTELLWCALSPAAVIPSMFFTALSFVFCLFSPLLMEPTLSIIW